MFGFDITKYFKDEVLEDYLDNPIRIKGKNVIDDPSGSGKYDVEIQHAVVITVVKKGE